MVTVDDLPLLGEPLAIELANTLYFDGGDATDFLATPGVALLWLEHAAPRDADFPRTLTIAETGSLRALRDAVFEVVSARADRRTPSAAAVRQLNRNAALACARAELVWDGATPLARVKFNGDRFPRMCAQLATSCIELCTTPEAGEVRRCEGPGCSLLFVQQHGRRRFCHESCSHRARQRRYAHGLATPN